MPPRFGLKSDVPARRLELEQPRERDVCLWAAQGGLRHELHAQGVADERKVTERGGARASTAARAWQAASASFSRRRKRVAARPVRASGSGQRVLVRFLERLTVELGCCVDVVVVRARECEPDEDACALRASGQFRGETLEHHPHPTAVS